MTIRITKLVLLASTFLLALVPMAQAASFAMMFEGVAPPGGSLGSVSPYSESGFTLTSNDSAYAIFDSANAGVNTNGSDIFGWCASDCDPQTLTVTGPGVFDLVSIDVASLSPGNNTPGMSVDITGFFSGGGSTFVSLPSNATWTTHPLAGFVNLISVSIVAIDPTPPTGAKDLNDSAIDNLQFSTGEVVVPEPSTFVFLGTGLLGLLWYQRRRRAQ
jgi:PEP-CTERM motif-containing protein